MVADGPVRADIGAAEPVYRLFRIADDEQLARFGAGVEPVLDAIVSGGEQQQDFRLHRIGILELVHEDAGEPTLQVAADLVIGPQQIARAGQQIGEVERPFPALECLILFRRRLQRFLQQRREVTVGVSAKLQQIRVERIARGQDVGANQLAVLRAVALPSLGQSLIAGEIDQPRFPRVEIALPERLLELNLPALSSDAIERLEQVVLVRTGAAHRGERMQRRDQPIDLSIAIERSADPRVREIAQRRQRPAGAAQPFDRTAVLQATE